MDTVTNHAYIGRFYGCDFALWSRMPDIPPFTCNFHFQPANLLHACHTPKSDTYHKPPLTTILSFIKHESDLQTTSILRSSHRSQFSHREGISPPRSFNSHLIVFKNLRSGLGDPWLPELLSKIEGRNDCQAVDFVLALCGIWTQFLVYHSQENWSDVCGFHLLSSRVDDNSEFTDTDPWSYRWFIWLGDFVDELGC